MTGKPQFPNEQSAAGEFKRQADAFRDWVTADGSSGYRLPPVVIISMSHGPAPGHAARSLRENSKSSNR